MKEFIEKLIGALEEEKNETYSEMNLLLDKEYLLPCNMNQIDMEEYRCSTFEEVISIVNQLAEDSSAFRVPLERGGWIPVSERLPEKEEYLKDDGRFIVTDGNRSYEGSFDIYRGKFQRDCFCSVIEDDKCVIAWMPLPEKYKGE